MPTYEYACSKCGHQFEVFQPMRDKPLRKCPKCAKMGLKRLVGSGAGVIFKGSGFYVNDYGRKAHPKAAAAEPKAAPDARSASEPKPAGIPSGGGAPGAPASADSTRK
jgi:putative FmdB family regulatory protein